MRCGLVRVGSTKTARLDAGITPDRAYLGEVVEHPSSAPGGRRAETMPTTGSIRHARMCQAAIAAIAACTEDGGDTDGQVNSVKRQVMGVQRVSVSVSGRPSSRGHG